MKQRVAIARALANRPRMLLMDEPFGALDAQTRCQMQSYLLQIWKQVDITILFITHDLDEAVYLADRILILDAHPGRVRELMEVPVPRPRDPEQFLSPAFMAARRHLEELIHPRPSQVAGQAAPLPHGRGRRRRRMTAGSLTVETPARRPDLVAADAARTSALRHHRRRGAAPACRRCSTTPRDPLERYNMPDTLKAQFTAFLTAGRVLYSDMGRVLASIVDDTAAGTTRSRAAATRRRPATRFGEGSYQELRNEFHRNGRDNLLVELGKHGLGKRDVVANVNFFVRGRRRRRRRRWPGSPATAAPAPPSSCASRWTRWSCCRTRRTRSIRRRLRAAAGGAGDRRRARPRAADDPCRLSRPENGRGFALTAAYLPTGGGP